MLYDPWNAENLTQRLEQELGIKRKKFAQTITAFNEPSLEFERRILNKTLCHNNNPVLNWQAANVLVKTDANNNIRPIKRSKDDYRTVDGVVASVMSIAEATREKPSFDFYETHGLEIF